MLVTCLFAASGDDGRAEMPRRLNPGGPMRRTMICVFAGGFIAFAVGPVRGAEEARAQAVLRTHCGACHGPDGTGKGGFDYLLDRDRLVARNQVVPGKPG